MQPDEFFDNPELRALTVTTNEFAVAMSDGGDISTHEQVSVLLSIAEARLVSGHARYVLDDHQYFPCE
jgi:hypothetical protein